MREAPVTMALRTGDDALREQVAALVQWWRPRLMVRPPGGLVPQASVLIDSVDERNGSDPPWPGAIPVSRKADSGVVRLPEDSDDFVDAVATALARSGSRKVGVLGCRGGIGASLIAALLARELAVSTGPVALVELEGGLEVMLGIEDVPGPRWVDLTEDAAPFIGPGLVDLLPRWHQVVVLCRDERGLAEPRVMQQALRAVAGTVEALVVDLGQREDLVAEVDGVVLVTSAEPVSLARAVAMAGELRRCRPEVDVRVALREMPGIDVDRAALAELCGVDDITAIPHARGLASDLAHGMTPGDRRRSRLVRVARTLAGEVFG